MPEEAKIVNYPANSHKAKSDAQTIEEEEAREKKVKPVVTGKVTQRKPSLGKRMAESFTGDDAKSVGEYIIFDVVIPGARDMLYNAFAQGLERKLYGEVRAARPRPNSGSTAYKPSYSSYSKPASQGSRPAPSASRRSSSVHEFNEFVFESRVDAEVVLDGMTNLVDQYEVCSIADLKDLMELTGSFVDNKWGWYDLREVKVRPIRGGYMLDLPNPEPID